MTVFLNNNERLGYESAMLDSTTKDKSGIMTCMFEYLSSVVRGLSLQAAE